MANVSNDSGNKLDVELNLVPFIDLLSTLVLFLLVTAVWLQVSGIPAAIDSKGKSEVSQAPQTRLMINVTSRGYRMTWPSQAAGRYPAALLKIAAGSKSATGYDTEKLIAILKKATEAKSISSVGVSGDDDAEYSAVIEAIDSAKTAGVPAVALSVN